MFHLFYFEVYMFPACGWAEDPPLQAATSRLGMLSTTTVVLYRMQNLNETTHQV